MNLKSANADCTIMEFLDVLRQDNDLPKFWANIKIVMDQKHTKKFATNPKYNQPIEAYAKAWETKDYSVVGHVWPQSLIKRSAEGDSELGKEQAVFFYLRPEKKPVMGKQKKAAPSKLGKETQKTCEVNGYKLLNVLSVRFHYVPGLMIVDMDDADPAMAKVCHDKFGHAPYTKTFKKHQSGPLKGERRGKHYFIIVKDMPAFSDEIDVFSTFKGDLLGHDSSKSRNIWEEQDRVVYNGKAEIPVYTYSELIDVNELGKSSLMSCKFFTGVKDKAKVPEYYLEEGDAVSDDEPEQAEPVAEPEPAVQDKKKELTKATASAMNGKRYIPTVTEYTTLLSAANPDCAYDTWIKLGFASSGFGDKYFKYFDKWSAKCPEKPQKGSQGYPGREVLQGMWDEWKNKDGAKLGWSGMRKRVKDNWPKNFSEVMKEDNFSMLTNMKEIYDEQCMEIFIQFMGEVIDESHDSDYMAINSKDAKNISFIRYKGDTGYWKVHDDGSALALRTCSKQVLPMLLKMIAERDQVREDSKDEEGKLPPEAYIDKQLKNAHAQYSKKAIGSTIATYIHSYSFDNKRALLLDSNESAVDGNRFKFPFDNMLVDLRTGEIRLARREENLSKTAGYDLNLKLLTDDTLEPNERCLEVWAEIMEWLETLFVRKVPEPPPGSEPEPDYSVPQGMVNELSRSLVAYNLWEHLILMTGTGGNGKSQFCKFMRRVFGNFGGVLKSEFWTAKGGDADKPDTSVTNCAFCRWASSNELVCKGIRDGKEYKVYFNEMQVKLLTGGDFIPMRYMRQEQFEKEVEASFFVACNELPGFDGKSRALQRRFQEYKFPFSFGTFNKDQPNYSEGASFDVDAKLGSDEWRDVMIIMLMKNFRDIMINPKTKMPYRKRPYKIPPSVKQSTDSLMQDNQDYVALFVQWAFTKTEDVDDIISVEAVAKAHAKYCGGYDDNKYLKKIHEDYRKKVDDVGGYKAQGLYMLLANHFTFDKKAKLYKGIKLIPQGQRAPRLSGQVDSSSEEEDD